MAQWCLLSRNVKLLRMREVHIRMMEAFRDSKGSLPAKVYFFLSGESSPFQCGQQKQWRVSEIGKFKILLPVKSKFIFSAWIRYCFCSWKQWRQHWWFWNCKCADDDKSRDFCQSVGLLPKQVKCNCGDIPSKVYKISQSGRKRQQFRFQCNKQKCKRKYKNHVALRKKTWFENSNLSLRKSLLCIPYFVQTFPYNLAINETSISSASDSDNPTHMHLKVQNTL